MKRKTIERPAYQEYAANIMGRREWRSMSFAERGLWITMKLDCWINQAIPANQEQLSRYIGFTPDEVKRLLPQVMWHFDERGEDIICPSLEKYRDEQDERIAKQAAGGKRGAAKTNSSRKALQDKDSSVSSTTAGNSQAPRRVSVGSLDQTRLDQTKPTQPLKGDFPEAVDPFVAEMEAAEARGRRDPFSAYSSDEYRKASDGE